MKVFISWSGDLSREIAVALYDWLPMVLQSIQPYMSSESIEKGTRWATSVADELEGSCLGLVVLTPENTKAPWIHFEAGALAKVVGGAKLAPILFGLKPSEVGSPLSQFQVTQFTREEVLRLLRSINNSSGSDTLPDTRLERMHNALWTQLDEEVRPILTKFQTSAPRAVVQAADDNSKVLEEVLTLVRQQAQILMNPERFISETFQNAMAEMSGTQHSKSEGTLLRGITRSMFRRWRSLRTLISKRPEAGFEDEHLRAVLLAARGVEDALAELMGLTERGAPRRFSIGSEDPVIHHVMEPAVSRPAAEVIDKVD